MSVRRMRRRVVGTAIALALSAAGLGLATRISLRGLPNTLGTGAEDIARTRVLDRDGVVLSRSYDGRWNAQDTLRLHEIPRLLREAFVEAEDRRFLDHHGVDWRARVTALWENLRAGRAVRGASTISEQVVRMLHPRPRTLWTRWLEGFESAALERRFDKGEILEFYLNQVPYASRRRGIAQAARHWFDREVDTLSAREMLALAVLVRSPGRLDPRRSTAVESRIDTLARRMHEAGRIDAATTTLIHGGRLELGRASLDVDAPHFVRHVRGRLRADTLRATTSLDGSLQQRARAILEHQLRRLADREAGDGAVLVVDHRTDEVLAWVNAGDFAGSEGGQIDAVLAARQPGSTLKPFLYGCALENGWTAATVIDDSPLAQPVGGGLHRFRNYGRTHYGPVRLRQALGNSLNVPAVRAVQHVTPEAFLARLRKLGFDSLDAHPQAYGEGLALGNGEVTLLELVSAYATLARGGVRRPLRVLADGADRLPPGPSGRVFDAEVASLIAHILADPAARSLEFGAGGVLDLPAPAAVKTGTSSDYRDAWAVGFSERHTVGVWIGNLDRRPMHAVTGATGPALVMRSLFAELRRGGEAGALPISRRLLRAEICATSGRQPVAGCRRVLEWFRAGHVPGQACFLHGEADLPRADGAGVRLVSPSPGLHLALDPRIPDELEAFAFVLDSPAPPRRVEWLVDERTAGITGPGERRFAWAPVRGDHVVRARVDTGGTEVVTPGVRVIVK